MTKGLNFEGLNNYPTCQAATQQTFVDGESQQQIVKARSESRGKECVQDVHASTGTPVRRNVGLTNWIQFDLACINGLSQYQ